MSESPQRTSGLEALLKRHALFSVHNPTAKELSSEQSISAYWVIHVALMNASKIILEQSHNIDLKFDVGHLISAMDALLQARDKVKYGLTLPHTPVTPMAAPPAPSPQFDTSCDIPVATPVTRYERRSETLAK